MNPKKTEVTEDLPAEITWEFAQKEIAQVKGFATAMGAGMSKGIPLIMVEEMFVT
ncbi:hypothetical protein DPMN_170949 [Dreissena polymorpha]|uniref:Uncharacterized protein n=1 Tax=Dreissena polymorpha TaxID=45954 RepID=A0A9D4DZJ5_DREPO|nr:hypothetical protein DPMN_170949 [Dreissena polymorpha]